MSSIEHQPSARSDESIKTAPGIVIEAAGLSKTYRVPVREAGMWNALGQLVRRKYRDVEALVDFDLRISSGESVGLVGPNGAGKSTAVKMMTGILKPTRGSIRITGLDPIRRRSRNARNIGVVFGQRTGLLWDIPVEETFELMRRIYELPRPVYERNRDYVVERLGLSGYMSQPARTLSLGQRVKADLAIALLHGPKILFLDEPTIGLDIEIKEQVRVLLREIYREAGVTVLLTTHDMRDIEEVCERIVVIDHGRKAYDGSQRELRAEYGYKRRLQLKILSDSESAVGALKLPSQAVVLDSTSTSVSIEFDQRECSASDLIALCMERLRVLDASIEESSVESIIKDIYANITAGRPG